MCNEYEPDQDDEREASVWMKDSYVKYGLLPHHKARPTDLGHILHPDDEPDRYHLTDMNWGFLVPWDKKPLTNAKSETLTTLPTFKPHLHHRCLILARTFTEKRVKFRPPDRKTFCIAGLWRIELKADTGKSFTMLTTTPNETVAPYHHRMPFLLRPEQHWEWLCGDWEKVLADPDKRPLEKIEKQPSLF